MKKNLGALLAAFFLVFGANSASATHIIGGEITYKCLGGSVYEITLNVFRDCFNGIPPFDDPAWIGIYDNDFGNEIDSLKLSPLSVDTLDIVLANPCLSVPPNVCVETAVYRGTVNLPFLAGGYKLIYMRCCRNKLIQNIVNPEDAGATFLTEITEKALLAGCNSSPTFINWPPVAICVGEPIDWDHSAKDAEGDSLVYRLCIPQNGASPDVPMPQPPDVGTIFDIQFAAGYGLTDFLNNGSFDPLDRLRIDANTGFMTGIPRLLGNFVVAVCLEEWRNGELLTVIQRDFQYNVAQCGNPTSAFFAPEVVCGQKAVDFENQSTNALGSEWFFDWPEDQPFSTEKSPTHTYQDSGRYTVALISLAPNPICADTFFKEIWVTEPLPVTATANPDTLYIGKKSQLTATLPGGGTGWNWSPAGPLSDPTKAATEAGPLTETTVFTVTATDVNGCETEAEVLLFVIPPPCDEPFVFFPNAFSPNGDGKNDLLGVEGLFVEEANWVIYNRWGEKLFEATKPNDVWDGTFLGETLPPDSYGFYLRARCVGGTETVRKGNVTLLR